MGGEPAVAIRDVTVRYGGFTAVGGLTLAVGRGERVALLGPNGAGKSTTLRVLAGQLRPTVGSASVAGCDVVRDRPRIPPLVGYVPDRDNHFDEFTGRRNLAFFAGLYAAPPERIDECLRLLELDAAADRPVRGYSLGMRRKLLLARALLHRPAVLLLDEPTANLDAHAVGVVRRTLGGLAAAGCAVLLTTHDLDEVESLCDCVAVLRRGRLAALDAPAALRERFGAATVRDAFLALNST
jgi:ABC-type multidrug transport system ATPase subunit